MVATLELYDEEIAVLVPREDVEVADWVERHRFVAEGPAIGFWSNRTFPPATEIMRTVVARTHTKVVVTGPPQKAKTEASIINPMLYCLFHRGVDCCYVMPAMTGVNKNWTKKIRPAIDKSPTLADQLLEREEGGTKDLRNFMSGVGLYMAGADSSAALSSFTVPVVFCDEVDKYATDIGGEGHPCDLAFARTKAFPSEACIHVETCTVTSPEGRIWKGWLEGTQAMYFVPCPACGRFQVLTRDRNPPREAPATRLVFDETSKMNGRDDVWMACADDECDHRITQSELPAMLAGGKWVGKGEPTRTASFWYSAWYWPFADWADLANEYVESRGDPDSEKVYQQQADVIPWKEPEADEDMLTVTEMESHVGDGYEARAVPAEADVIIETVDVQSGYVYYIVRGWRRADGTSWLIDLGTIGKPLRGQDETKAEKKQRRKMLIASALDIVDERAIEGWPVWQDPDGRHVGLTCGLIDRGYEPDAIASWHLAKHRRVWFTIRGAGAGTNAVLWPRKASKDGRGRPYRWVDVNDAKHIVRRLLRIPRGQPGHWHMPSEGIHKNTLRAYYRHMTSERFNRDRPIPRWENIEDNSDGKKKPKRLPNHFWDCETYQISAARACGVCLASMPQVQPKKKPAPSAPSSGRNEFEDYDPLS